MIWDGTATGFLGLPSAARRAPFAEFNQGWTGPGGVRRLVDHQLVHHKSDFVIEASGGVQLSWLGERLATEGQALPALAALPESLLPEDYRRIRGYFPDEQLDMAIALRLPEPLEGRFRNYEDWVLGLTMVLPDGSAVRSGSRVSKNVAGFDAYHLAIGGRNELVWIESANLRVMPLAALQLPELRFGNGFQEAPPERFEVVCVEPADTERFSGSFQKEMLFGVPESCLFWMLPESGWLKQEFPRSWSVEYRKGPGARWPERSAVEQRLWDRAKDMLDPTRHLGGGEP